MGLVLLNILELKLNNYFKEMDSKFMYEYDLILEDLDVIDDN